MKNKRDRAAHVTRGDVFRDLGFSPDQAAALKFKADLYRAILISARDYSQKQLQRVLAEPQPRISELMNGKIANKSLEKLLEYAGKLGIEAKVTFIRSRRRPSDRDLALAG
ncbi:MAG TPA: XRE family transcriptional regulator [Candidatus Acidoferrales bacterium]|nr:XRE family transcriptional regulator [Candidatus Acidoferrales bacterium]